MKHYILAILFFVFQVATAQETICADTEATLKNYLSDKDYKKANETLSVLKSSCPTFSEQAFLLALEVHQHNIEMASNDEKETAVREIIKLYQLYDKKFPNNTNGNYEKSAMALHNNKVGSNTEIFSLLEQAFEEQKNSFQNPEALFVYLQQYLEKYKSEKITFSHDKVYDKYIDVISLIETNKKNVPNNVAVYDRLLLTIESLMKEFLVSEKIVSYAKKTLPNKKDNIYWLQSVSKLLSEYSKNEPIFESVAAELHSINPTSKSAYYLATFNLNSKKQEQAIAFFSESLQLDTNKISKANTAYSIASILASSDKEMAKKMVLTALENNPSNGKYYLFLANLYANAVTECGANEIEKNAIYKLASDTALMAIQAEPRLKGTSEEMSNSYLKKISKLKANLKSVKVGCWINQTVIL